MAVIRYHRYVGEVGDELDLDELVDALSDFFLESGFGRESEDWGGDDLQALHDAILEALLRRGLLSPDQLEKLMADQEALDRFKPAFLRPHPARLSRLGHEEND